MITKYSAELQRAIATGDVTLNEAEKTATFASGTPPAVLMPAVGVQASPNLDPHLEALLSLRAELTGLGYTILEPTAK